MLLRNPEIDLRFPNIPEQRSAALAVLARAALPQRSVTVSLDRVLAYMKTEVTKTPL